MQTREAGNESRTVSSSGSIAFSSAEASSATPIHPSRVISAVAVTGKDSLIFCRILTHLPLTNQRATQLAGEGFHPRFD